MLPRRAGLSVAVAVAACGGATPRPAARVDPPDPPPAAPPTPAWDSGEFELTIKGVDAGVERFTIVQRPTGYLLTTSTMLGPRGYARLIETELTTDLEWRPTAGAVRDVKDGVTVTTLAGDPLHLATTVAGAPSSEVTAREPVDLFIADNTIVHYAPVCTIAGPTARIAFPGMTVAIGPDIVLPAAGTLRRDLDLGGASRVRVYCEADRLVAVTVPLAGFVAIRRGFHGDLRGPRPEQRELPPVPPGLTELSRQVRVKASKHGAAATLGCTLVVPASYASTKRRDRKRALPAVVFLTGSGPQDRNGDAVGPAGVKMATFRVLAHALGQADVASLRCDDRGTAASTGDFGLATLDTFVGDAAAMVAALRREPAIDPARIGLAGHSEGGVIAPRVAASDRRLAGIALLAAPGRPLDVVLLEQVARSLRRAGATDADRDASLGRYRAVFAAIAAGAALPATAEGREWTGGEAWLRSHLARDPAATARKLARVPVLIVQGGTDQQVDVADAEALEAALHEAANPAVTYRFYPELNHMLAHSTSGDISEYGDLDATVDAAVVADVVGFFAAL